MKKTIFLSFVLCVNIYYSQTHRFIYELTIHKIQDTVKVNMALDINKDQIKFYDLEFVKGDSLRKSGKNHQYFSDADQNLIRKINSYENNMYYSKGYDFFVISSKDKMDWKLEKEVKKVKNYTLQKATTKFGGRDWIAWFCKEIPFQEGPYKFRGLSGLIFEIYDTENVFHYTFIENKNIPETYNTTDFLETHYGKKPIKVSLKKYQDMRLVYYHNIVQDLNNFVEKGGQIASVSEDKSLNNKEEILAEKKAIQQSIKDYYLPIERDKAIPYPTK